MFPLKMVIFHSYVSLPEVRLWMMKTMNSEARPEDLPFFATHGGRLVEPLVRKTPLCCSRSAKVAPALAINGNILSGYVSLLFCVISQTGYTQQ